MKEPNQYADQLTALNVCQFGADRMPHTDDVYRVPDDWLKANAKRFHFTNEQIIEAAKPQFEGDSYSVIRFYEYPAVCGVYFLVADGQIVYVGQSNRIPRRIFQHRDNLVPFDSVAWFEAPEFFLKPIEAYYINRIKPRFNADVRYDGRYAELATKFDSGASLQQEEQWTLKD